MAGPWITGAELRQYIADSLSVSVGGLAPKWTAITDRAVQTAYADIRGRLLARGYTDAQLDGWDDRVQYNTDQALFWAYINGGGPVNQSDGDINKLDRRDELKDPGLPISINGVLVVPGATADTGAAVGSGPVVMVTDGTDFGTTFGMRILRKNGKNQYGDDIPRYW